MTTSTEEKQQPLAGKVLIAGGTDWPVLGRRPKGADNWERPDLHTPHIFRTCAQISFTRVITTHSGCHAVFLDTDKHAWIVGRNDHGQLGTGNQETLFEPKRIDKREFPNAPKELLNAEIVDAACGRHHTILITSTGKVFTTGWNNMGQIGYPTDSDDQLVFKQIQGSIVNEHIVQASAGINFSMLLTDQGKIYCMGSLEKGQLGNGRTGEHIHASKTIFAHQSDPVMLKALQDKKIVQISCGQQHTLALDDEGYVYSWGFGGYGRLGHGEQKDLLYPKMINAFASNNKVMRATKVCAGPTNSVVLDGQRLYYLFGKWKTSGDGSVGQPWTTPRQHHDIMAYSMRHVTLGGVTMFNVADEGASTLVIGFGQNANCGELGLGVGQPKSATKPMRIETLDGFNVFDIAAGQNTTFFLVVPPGDDAGDISDKWSEIPKYPIGVDIPENCVQCDQDRPDDAPLECEKCEKPYHLKCLDPPLEQVPEGEWFCPDCANEYVLEDDEDDKNGVSESAGRKRKTTTAAKDAGKKRKK